MTLAWIKLTLKLAIELSVFLKRFIFFNYVCANECGFFVGQKRVLDSPGPRVIVMSCPVWCWELNLSLLEEQCILLTTL